MTYIGEPPWSAPIPHNLLDFEGWVRNTKEGKNWLASMAAEIGVPVQTAFPFMEPGDTHVHDEGTIYCNVCASRDGSIKEQTNGQDAGQSEEHHNGG